MKRWTVELSERDLRDLLVGLELAAASATNPRERRRLERLYLLLRENDHETPAAGSRSKAGEHGRQA